ncbi:MAG TPA: GAF domain-containing protein [Sphingobium sp.]|uniref:GAF domain-containing protein n=1 Tax=Sphingobium sp. TaxID=1912891 RepID=UPI002ED13B05
MTNIAPQDLRELLNLEAIRRHHILDIPRDGSFDALAELVRRFLDCKAAVVSIVDRDGVFLMAHPGLDVDRVGGEPGLCASAVMQDEPWIVEDAEIDPRTLANPLVAGDLGLRFYAGIPLRTVDGHNIGVLAALDFQPRKLSDFELDSLKLVAKVVVDMLELRLAAWAKIAEADMQAGREG